MVTGTGPALITLFGCCGATPWVREVPALPALLLPLLTVPCGAAHSYSPPTTVTQEVGFNLITVGSVCSVKWWSKSDANKAEKVVPRKIQRRGKLSVAENVSHSVRWRIFPVLLLPTHIPDIFFPFLHRYFAQSTKEVIDLTQFE